MSCRRLVAVALLSLPGVVMANEPSAADLLFREGRAAMDRGDYETACPLLARSQEIDPAGGTLLNLALCYERGRHWSKAIVTWQDALERARKDARDDRAREAQRHLADLHMRQPQLHLLLASEAPADLEIVLDDEPLVVPEARPGTLRLRVDPGPHVLLVRGVAQEVMTRRFEVNERQQLVLDATTGEPPRAFAAALPVAPQVPPVQPHARLSLPAKLLFGVAAAGGGIALATGAFAVSDRLAYSNTCIEARAYCGDDEAIARGERAHRLAWVSTTAAGVAIGAAVVALLLPRRVVLVPGAVAKGPSLSLRVDY